MYAPSEPPPPKVTDEEPQVAGPYRIAWGRTPQELQDSVNRLFREWPSWHFMGFFQVGDVSYREMLKVPEQDSSPLSGLAIARAVPGGIKLQ